MVKEFLKVDFLKYSLLTPVRVGKSYFGIIVFGVMLFISYMALGYPIAFILNFISEDWIVNQVSNRLVHDLFFLPANLLYGIYDKLWIALIAIAVIKVEELKYALPRDIIAAMKQFIMPILLFSFLVTLAGSVLSSIVDLLETEWINTLFRYFLWPMVMVCFVIGIVSICGYGKTIKEALINCWDYLNKESIFSLVSIYLLYLIAYIVPNKLIRFITSPYYENYSSPRDDNFNYVLNGVIYGSQIISGLLEVYLLTILVGAVLYSSRIFHNK